MMAVCLFSNLVCLLVCMYVSVCSEKLMRMFYRSGWGGTHRLSVGGWQQTMELVIASCSWQVVTNAPVVIETPGLMAH